MPQGSRDSQRNHSTPSRWVLVGACGAGMQSFARILESELEHQWNAEILATDIDMDQLQTIQRDFRRLKTKDWSSDWSDLFTAETRVVHSIAVPPESMILEQARHAHCCILPLPDALGQIASRREQICIAGTHGKTTTTGLVSWILQHSHREAFHFIGGEFCQPSNSSMQRSPPSSEGNWAVLESCEYRNSFLSLNPKVAIVTGIEPDHFDFFASFDDLSRSFASFMNQCHPTGTIIVNADCSTSLTLARQAGRSIITCSITSCTTDWSAKPTAERCLTGTHPPSGQRVSLYHQGEFVTECEIALSGEHNRRNWLTGLVGAVTCGVDLGTAVCLASTFPGMRRRFEYRGHWNQVHWIDDYAHHPTAIRETLKTAQGVFPSSRVIAVVEPHQISRTEHLFAEYVESLTSADEVLLLPVLPARENARMGDCERLSSRLVCRISESGGRAMLAANLDQVLRRLDHSCRPGDVVITMGAGRTHTIHDEIHRRLQRNSAA